MTRSAADQRLTRPVQSWVKGNDGMVATAEQVTDEIQFATAEEGREIFDYQARKLMGMSGDEFLRRWDAGEYAEIADTAGHRHIMRLWGLMPFVRKIS